MKKTTILIFIIFLTTISVAFIFFFKKSENKQTYLSEYEASIDYSCQTDSDCVIKDVHNCCGYYPECVNINAKVDPEFVSKACEKEGLAGVCGFPSIDSCRCSFFKCKGYLKEK